MTAISTPRGAKGATAGIFHVIGHAIKDVYRRFQQRQTLHELAALDDHLLEDIGIRRAELTSAPMSKEKDMHLPRHQIG